MSLTIDKIDVILQKEEQRYIQEIQKHGQDI